MKLLPYLPVLTAACLLSACYYAPRVPDIPYTANPANRAHPDVWTTMPSPGIQNMEAPIPAPRNAAPPLTPIPAATPAPVPQVVAPIAPPRHVAPATPTGAISNSGASGIAPIAPTPTPKPTAAPKPTPQVDLATRYRTDPKSITNQGPIPVATRVEGDPTRVYNPLDPSKTIRVIDPRTGQPYPSGHELKVRGTNYHFYVP